MKRSALVTALFMIARYRLLVPSRLVREHSFALNREVDLDRSRRLAKSCGLVGAGADSCSVSAIVVGKGLRGHHVVNHGRDSGNLSSNRSTQFAFEVGKESFCDDLTKRHCLDYRLYCTEYYCLEHRCDRRLYDQREYRYSSTV